MHLFGIKNTPVRSISSHRILNQLMRAILFKVCALCKIVLTMWMFTVTLNTKDAHTDILKLSLSQNTTPNLNTFTVVLIISRAPFNMFSFRSWLLRGQFPVWSTSILDDKLHLTYWKGCLTSSHLLAWSHYFQNF